MRKNFCLKFKKRKKEKKFDDFQNSKWLGLNLFSEKKIRTLTKHRKVPLVLSQIVEQIQANL